MTPEQARETLRRAQIWLEAARLLTETRDVERKRWFYSSTIDQFTHTLWMKFYDKAFAGAEIQQAIEVLRK